MARWTNKNIPDQTGRVAIVTGANSGIGLETARELARKGATVVLACRNPARADDAVRNLQDDNLPGPVSAMTVDLSDLDSVEAFANAFKAEHDRLDMLILNAGVMVPPESKTAQGFELQFGVNHLGHYALTGHLLDALNDDGSARIVVVSSTAARMSRMNFDDLQFFGRGYKPWPAYGQSKLANQLFARELQRRIRAAGKPILVTAAHPGWTETNLQKNSGVGKFFNPILAMKPPQGALPTLRAATDPGAEDAAYYGPNGMMQMRGYPVVVPMVNAARKDDDAERLWEVSEQLTEVRYPLG